MKKQLLFAGIPFFALVFVLVFFACNNANQEVEHELAMVQFNLPPKPRTLESAKADTNFYEVIL